jgi:hypothetical protein
MRGGLQRARCRRVSATVRIQLTAENTNTKHRLCCSHFAALPIPARTSRSRRAESHPASCVPVLLDNFLPRLSAQRALQDASALEVGGLGDVGPPEAHRDVVGIVKLVQLRDLALDIWRRRQHQPACHPRLISQRWAKHSTTHGHHKQHLTDLDTRGEQSSGEQSSDARTQPCTKSMSPPCIQSTAALPRTALPMRIATSSNASGRAAATHHLRDEAKMSKINLGLRPA